MGERIVARLRTDFAFSVILQICPVTNTVNLKGDSIVKEPNIDCS